MPKADFHDVDAYLATLPAGAQSLLVQVRDAIRDAVPRADEVISYHIPGYTLPAGPVLYFAGWKKHYALYPASAELVSHFKQKLAPYKVVKHTIRFPLDKPVPTALIKQIARYRVKELSRKKRDGS